MSKLQDTRQVVASQYRDATNLRSRCSLHACFSTSPVSWHRWVFDQLGVPADAGILELGCGPGTLWRENRERLPSGWRLVLTDVSPGMALAARRVLAEVAVPVACSVADAVLLPFGDGSFDRVIANHMLYHVEDLGRAFSEVRRVLRAGGQFRAATNGSRHMQELHALIASVVPALARPGLSFTLENGEALLKPFFRQVELRRHADSLDVNESEPLCRYVESMSDLIGISRQQLNDVRREIERYIRERGKMVISKDSGVFIAH